MLVKFLLILMIIFSPLFRGSVSPLAFGSLQVLTALIVLLWFSHMAKEGIIRFKRTALDIPLLLFLLLAAASIFRPPYLHDSFVDFFKLINLTAIFYLTVNHIKDKSDIKKVVNAVVMVGGVLSIFGIIQYLGGITNSWWDRKNFLSSVYVNHNHFAGLLELCMPLCIGAALSERERIKKLFYGYVFLIMLIAFMFSMSRGAWLSLSVSMSAMLILLYKEKFIKPGFFIIFFLLVAIGFLVIKRVDLGLFLGRVASYREFDLEGRLEIWKGTLKIIQDAPFFGTGLGTFIYYFPKYRPLGFNLFANYAHNDYLQLASEAGIISLFCALYMFFLIVKKGITTYLASRSNFKKAVSIGAAAGIASMLVHSLVDFNLRIPANAILFTILSGIIFSMRSSNEKPERYLEIKLGKTAVHLARPVFAVIIFVWIIYMARFVAAETILAKTNSLETKGQIIGLNKAINVLPENSEYYKKLARIYTNRASISIYKERDLLMALEYYRLASELNPMDGWARIGMGDAFSYLGSYEEAKDFYKQALDLDPNNSYYLKKYGDTFARLGDAQHAADIFKRVSLLEENSFNWVDTNHNKYNPKAYIERGDFYYREGNLNGAFNMYKLAEEIDPKADYIKIKISNLLERMGKENGSDNHAVAFDDMNNLEKIIFLNSKARYLISTGKYKEADALLEKAFSIDIKDCITLQNKIDLLQRQRRPFEEIRPYMQKISELNNNAEGNISGKGIILTFNLEKDGLMLGGGTKEIGFMLPLGLVDVKISAAGTLAQGEWPHMLVRMNSTPILSTYVSSALDAEFDATGLSQEGEGSLKVEFSNDYFDSLTREDRNLNINKITLEYKYPDYES